jgi:DDE superfamily endonuclease
MTGEIFEQWLIEWDHKLRRTSRKILLLVDNFAGHNFNTRVITNIRVERFSANMTSHVQPMDAGIIHCFKAHYRQHFLRRALDLFDDGADDIYAINQLQAMRLICTSWDNVSNRTIAHCWQKTNILPVVVDADFLSQAPDVIVLINSEQEAVLAGINKCYKVFDQVRPNHVNISVEMLVSPPEENDAIALESLNEDEIIEYITTNHEMEKSNTINEEEETVKPAMNTKAALTAIENLERFMELEDGQEFRNAANSLIYVKRTLRKKLDSGQKQTPITSFFEIQ